MPYPAHLITDCYSPGCRRICIVRDWNSAWRWRWRGWWWTCWIRPATTAGDQTRYRDYLTNFLQHFLLRAVVNARTVLKGERALKRFPRDSRRTTSTARW